MKELRCTCSQMPLLALVGNDERGIPYLHIKAWKGSKLITEVILTGGSVKILCRVCFRWYSVVFRTEKVTLIRIDSPVEIIK